MWAKLLFFLLFRKYETYWPFSFDTKLAKLLFWQAMWKIFMRSGSVDVDKHLQVEGRLGLHLVVM